MVLVLVQASTPMDRTLWDVDRIGDVFAVREVAVRGVPEA
jgi:hypothetical protein